MDIEYIENRIDKLEERIKFMERLFMELPFKLRKGEES